MPAIRSFTFKHYALLISSITLNREIMSPYSHYIKKGLVCVTIIKSFSHQPSFYSKYTKSNTHASYNMRSVPLNKYIFLTHLNSL